LRAPANRDFLDQWSPNLGSCPTSTNYVAPDRFGGVNIPTSYVNGPDLDRDGFPATVTVRRLNVVIAPFTPGIVSTAPDLVLDTDENDNDPNVPALSTYTTPMPLVSGHSMGPDADNDRVPASVTLLKATYTFDRRNGTVSCTTESLDDKGVATTTFLAASQRMGPVQRARALAWMKNLKSGGQFLFPEQQDLADALGMPRMTMSESLALGHLPKKVLAAVERGEILVRPAILLSRSIPFETPEAEE
jgi:hypothetical protein